MTANTYELSFKGEAGKSLRAAFPEFEVSAAHGKTVLRGQLVDRAALYGTIERIDSLGLELTDVHLLGEAERQPDDVE